MPTMILKFYEQLQQPISYIDADFLDLTREQKRPTMIHLWGSQLVEFSLKAQAFVAKAIYKNKVEKNKYKKLTNLFQAGLGLLSLPIGWIGGAMKGASSQCNPRPFEYLNNSSLPHIQDNEIAFLTFNASLYPDVMSYFHHLAPTETRYHRELDGLNKIIIENQFDTILLQEVFDREIAKKLAHDLSNKKLFKHFIYNLGDSAFGWPSGLFFATNRKVNFIRFIYFNYPFIVGGEFSIEAVANKGILYVVVENNNGYDIMINTHLKSSVGPTDSTRDANESLRANSVKILIQALFELIDDLEKDHKEVCNVYFGGDINISDVQENSNVTFERSNNRFSSVQFLFNLFPNEARNTWLKNKEGHPNDMGLRGSDGNIKPVEGVQFDHVGMFQYKKTYDKYFYESQVLLKPSVTKNELNTDHAALSFKARKRV